MKYLIAVKNDEGKVEMFRFNTEYDRLQFIKEIERLKEAFELNTTYITSEVKI